MGPVLILIMLLAVNLQKSGRAQAGEGQPGERPPECKQQ